MRRLIFAAALFSAPVSASAGTYLLICGPAPCAASDGTTQPAGTALNRFVWDGHARYSPPSGQQIVPDDGRPVYVPTFPASQ